MQIFLTKLQNSTHLVSAGI